MTRAACIVATAAVVIALGAYAWRGVYARYLTDDYCTAVTLRERGFVEAMKFHRQTWSGRYSYYAFKAIPESIGPATAPVMPTVMIVLFAAAAVGTLRRLTESRVIATMLGLSVVYAAIDGTPDVLAVGGPLVWETGLVTYMLPLVLYSAWAGLFFARFRGRIAVSALLMFLAGGLSETSLAAQGACTAGILLLTVVLRAREAMAIAAAGFASTLLAVYLVATAPGNVVRMSRLPPQQPFLDAVADALHLAYRYVGSNMFVGGASLILVLLGGVLLGSASTRIQVKPALLAGLVLLGAFVATILPSTWMLSMSPPPRALHVSNFFMIAALLALCAAAGAARPHYARAVTVALFVAAIIPLHSAATMDLEEGRRAAREMDRIVAALQAGRGRDVMVRSPWALAQRVLVHDPQFFTNRCMADYYGVRSLTVIR